MARVQRSKTLQLVANLLLVVLWGGLEAKSANAQEAGAPAATAALPSHTSPKDGAHRKAASKPLQRSLYYVDFRARTAASYGHAFVWYGRVGEKTVEVAGLHPATESVIPYILGHVIPVPSETGASYGDLDEEYVTANYRVFINEAEAKRVFAYIKHLQETSPLWHAPVYNCVAFIRDIAQYMGLNTPANHLLYPEDWVNELKQMNANRPQAPQTATASASNGSARNTQARALAQPSDVPQSTQVQAPPQSIY